MRSDSRKPKANKESSAVSQNITQAFENANQYGSERPPDAFDVARSAGRSAGQRSNERNAIGDAFPQLKNNASETQIVNALLTDNWPQHSPERIGATIVALQVLFEALPGLSNAASLCGLGSQVRNPPYEICQQVREAIDMLRSYRLAAEVVQQRDAGRDADRREQLNNAYIVEIEKAAVLRGEQYAKDSAKEARRAKRSK